MNTLSNIWMNTRTRIARLRSKLDPFFRIRDLEGRLKNIEANIYYEIEDARLWYPEIMGLRETLEYVIENKCSLARYGDGEFELMAGRNMSFEKANEDMKQKLLHILKHPNPSCLTCVPNVFGSLAIYRQPVRAFWRGAVGWMRPILRDCIEVKGDRGVAQNSILGDPQVSRAYLGVGKGERAAELFGLWKQIFKDRDLLIVEGRFSRLGEGNDLFDGAKSIRRIWCPATGAYSRYEKIKQAIEKNARKYDLILLALGATATILAYDLSMLGFQALDVGHIDVEYMWMRMGATKKVPIPGRYVNECAIGGREMKLVKGEAEKLNVIEIV